MAFFAWPRATWAFWYCPDTCELLVGIVRRSVSSVWKNVSDDFHSSASVPPDDHIVVPPADGAPPVTADSCWRAPMRSASAPVALSTLSGPMTPGCCGSSKLSLMLQLPRSNEAAATMLAVMAQRARYLLIIISVSSSVGVSSED